MPVYNLWGYSWNYYDTAGSLWFCSTDKISNFNTNTVNIYAFKSFKYTAKLLGNIEVNETLKSMVRMEL